MKALDVPSSSSAQNDSTSYIKCMICYKDFNSAKANRPDYAITMRIFDNCTRLLKVHLILPMQWNFRHEHLPFCTACTSTVTRLLELNEKLHIIQHEMRVTLRNIKIEILKTQDANQKRMMEPMGRRRGTRGSASHLEKVDYFRSFAVKDMDPDVRLNVNNVLLKAPAPGQQIPTVGLPFLQNHSQGAGLDINSAVVKPFFVKTTIQEDEYLEDDNAPSPIPDDIGDDNSDGASQSEVIGGNSVPDGLIKLPSTKPLTSPRDYVDHYYTKVDEHTYQCNFCERKLKLFQFKNCSNLKRHVVKAHEGRKGYQCKFCLVTFLSSSEGIAHIRREHSTPSKQLLTYKGCNIKDIPKQHTSPVVIPTEEILKRVIDLKGNDKRSDREIYKRHYKKVGDIYVCKICTRQLKSIKDIVRHVHASHKGKPNFQCSYCNKKFMERYMCVKHLKIAHDNVMQEEYQALIVNENEKTVDEDEEETSVTTNKAVTAHGSAYTKVGNMFKCKKCDFSSVYNASVHRHNRKVHQHVATRPGLVKFSFAKKTKSGKLPALGGPSKVQERSNDPTGTSGGQDGVLCVRPEDLDALIRPNIMDGKSKKKRYRCRKCSYGSMSACNVKRHVRDTHLKIRPYVCSFCKQGFYSRQKCLLHIILTHPQENEANLKKNSSNPLSKEDYGPPTLLPEVDLPENENRGLESKSVDSKEGILNDSRLRRRKSNVSYVPEVQNLEDENEIERLCIALPKSSKLPFSPELLSKYISESNSSFCLVCEKQFIQISHHIANVHEEVRHFQCFLCNRTFYFKSKCTTHIKEKCLKQNKKQGDSYINITEPASSSQPVEKLANVSKPGPKRFKLKASSKKAKATSKSQPLQSGVYQEYYEKQGKRYKCKVCKKRIQDSRRIATHFVANHKDIRPFACGHCEEKFYAKPMLTKHIYVSHPDVAAELAKEREKNLSKTLNGPQHLGPMDTGEASNFASNVDNEETTTTVKTESTWVEFSHPAEEARDQFLESNESETVNVSKSSSFQDMETIASSIPESSSTRNVDSYSVEKSIENDAPNVDYGVVVINQQSNLNCDPFIDKESANKCKVCTKSFKLRKLVIDHIKNVHLGVRRYQCEFCSKKYYHLAACKQHVEDNHPPGSTEQNNEERISGNNTGEQLTASFGSSDLQISNVRSQASMSHTPLVLPEEITMDAGMMDVEEPMSFEPWKELPSSQEKNIEPFFAVQSDDSGEEEDEEEPQFVVQEQNGFGFSTDYATSGTGIITDEVSIYDIVGTENIIELPLPVNPVQSDALDYSETGTGFSCNICQKEFAVRKSIINHVNVKHKQVARFRCKLCDKNYYHKYHVAQHIASIHMRKDIFKCRVCEKSYGHASGLKKHYAAAHGSVNFQSREQWCTLCKLPFQSPQDLISHMSRIHPV